jgi:acetyl esterase/lipase
VRRLIIFLLVFLALPPAVSGARPKAVKKVGYGTSAEQILSIWPSAQPNSPVCVAVHGGGWHSKTLGTLGRISRELAEQGCTTFDIEYRRDSATQSAFPLQVEDVEAATHYAIEHASAHNGDPSNVILLGTSAGGQLVGMAADHLDAAQPGMVAAVVSLSGPFDLTAALAEDRAGELPKKFGEHVPEALGCSLDTTCETPEGEATAAEWSADQQLPSSCAGSWLIFNSTDELIPIAQANLMTAALEAGGCPVTETIVPGKGHATQYWETVREEVFGFIASQP